MDENRGLQERMVKGTSVDKGPLIPCSPFGVDWVGRCGLQDEQAGAGQVCRYSVQVVDIEEAGHVQVEHIEFNLDEVFHDVDSIPLVEEIELVLSVEERFFFWAS